MSRSTLHTIAATVTDQQLDHLDGALRRTDSGEWIAERQNTAAHNSQTAVPAPPAQPDDSHAARSGEAGGRAGGMRENFRSAMTKQKVFGG